MICPSTVIIYSDSCTYYLFICITLSLFHSSTAAYLECCSILSLRYTLPAPSLLHSPRHDCRRRSLSMLVLSHSDTHYLNRHMVGCWCHEILIERCIIVLLLSNVSRYPTQLWLWSLSYSNHSFQLISIQCSVHHSDPPENHQSCYQEPFVSTANWR